MRDEWMTEVEREAARRNEKWTRLEAWSTGLLLAIVALTAAKAMFW